MTAASRYPAFSTLQREMRAGKEDVTVLILLAEDAWDEAVLLDDQARADEIDKITNNLLDEFSGKIQPYLDQSCPHARPHAPAPRIMREASGPIPQQTSGGADPGSPAGRR